jgi:hypothetical protein
MAMRRLTLLALAAIAALTTLVPAAPAQAAKRKQAAKPKITRVTPMRLGLGEVLTIRGKNFKAKPRANTIIFQGTDGKTAFVKPRSATKRKLVVKLPGSVARLLRLSGGAQQPTRLRIRVLAGRFSNFTPRRLSPVVVGLSSGGGPGGGGGPLVVCNKDSDHDNDLLSNALELQIKTDPCLMDTDGDGIEDGFEYQSARDLNDDESQDPNSVLPYPGKRPYPNPLYPQDKNTDFDGDVLTLAEEQSLWRFSTSTGRSARTLSPLYYSDGEQHSIRSVGSDGRRRPSLVAAGYERQANFLAWASGAGYRTVALDDGAPWWNHEVVRNSYGLLDMDRDGDETAVVESGYLRSETTYYDFRSDNRLSDDERDEDADGLTNYDETHGRMTPEYWAACYAAEAPFGLAYLGTDVVDPDTDGDGVRDGADDQDHDDIPNLMELSRNAASGLWDAEPQGCKPAAGLPTPPATHHPDTYGRVNPFNPCLPAVWSRTCTLHPGFSSTSAPFDGSLDWASLN